MTPSHAELTVWYLAVVLVVSQASAWAARLSEGSRLQTLAQRLFFACLALVGASTMISLWWGPGCCVLSGFSLAGMAVVATWDLGSARRAAA